MEKLKSKQMHGMNFWIWLIMCVIVIVCGLIGWMPADFSGYVALGLAFASLVGAIGDRIPIWKTYIGGGALLILIVGMLLQFFGVIPENVSTVGMQLFSTDGLLNAIIAVLLIAGMFTIPRKLVLSSMGKILAVVVVGILFCCLCTSLVGLLFGYAPWESILLYVFPIMGGGIPALLGMRAMVDASGIMSADLYVGTALASALFADIIAIIFAAVLAKVTDKKEGFNGKGELIRKGKGVMEADATTVGEATVKDKASALLIMFVIYFIATILGTNILPAIGPVQLHPFIWAMILAIAAHLLKLYPANILSGMSSLFSFCNIGIMPLLLFFAGISLCDFGLFLAVVTSVPKLIMCIVTVIAAFVGTAVLGKLLGFYPFETGVCGGLCMANAGMGGGVITLNVTKRMHLMPFATAASRLGTVFVLLGTGILIALI